MKYNFIRMVADVCVLSPTKMTSVLLNYHKLFLHFVLLRQEMFDGFDIVASHTDILLNISCLSESRDI